jgi:hypothetical protein
MIDALSSGQLIDVVIAVTLLECAALVFYHHLTKGGLAPNDYLLNLTAGLCLMLALRSALADAGWIWMVLYLMAAGLAHGTDLWTRWRRSQI